MSLHVSKGSVSVISRQRCARRRRERKNDIPVGWGPRFWELRRRSSSVLSLGRLTEIWEGLMKYVPSCGPEMVDSNLRDVSDEWVLVKVVSFTSLRPLCAKILYV